MLGDGCEVLEVTAGPAGRHPPVRAALRVGPGRPGVRGPLRHLGVDHVLDALEAVRRDPGVPEDGRRELDGPADPRASTLPRNSMNTLPSIAHPGPRRMPGAMRVAVAPVRAATPASRNPESVAGRRSAGGRSAP